ncbi:MAG: SapC family protein [Sphingomonadaceae bacterium]|nr:SapC family protein [Sphingomonadaceae bacterium]
MASAAPAPLPLLYKDLRPLSSAEHGEWALRRNQNASFLSGVHAVPLTVDEFVLAQRFMPIVFSAGENPVPLALMGLNDGVNVFFDDEGKLIDQRAYVPAYIRRYPFMLAKLGPDADELSLCFDPTSNVIGAYDDGEKLFAEGKPSETTDGILKFCEHFETSGRQTAQFMNELKEQDLLIQGEVSIQPESAEKPFVYRGFQMMSEAKLKELRGDVARKWIGNGLLALVYAHLMSLSMIREIFSAQILQGKMPTPQGVQPAPSDAIN